MINQVVLNARTNDATLVLSFTMQTGKITGPKLLHNMHFMQKDIHW